DLAARRLQGGHRVADTRGSAQRAPWRPPNLARIIHEQTEREAGRGPSAGAGGRSSCVTHSPDSPPCGRRTGRGGPTPPERTPTPDATRPDCTGADALNRSDRVSGASYAERGGTKLRGGTVGEPETEGYEGEAESGEGRDALVEKERAEDGGGEGTQGEEDRDAGSARVLEGPQPEEVAHPAAETDEDDGAPSARGDAGQRADHALAPGEDGEENHRGEHGEGAHGQGRILAELGPIEHAADRTAQGTQEHGELAQPLVRAAARLHRLVTEGRSHSRNGQEDGEGLRERQPLVAQSGRDHHGEEREGGEDEGGAAGRNEAQAVVEQSDEDAELRDAEERDGQPVASLEAQALAGAEHEGRQAQDADGIAKESEGGGTGLVDHEAGGDPGRADLHARGRRSQHRTTVGHESSRSHVSPTRSWPKLRCRSWCTRRKPACS